MYIPIFIKLEEVVVEDEEGMTETITIYGMTDLSMVVSLVTMLILIGAVIGASLFSYVN